MLGFRAYCCAVVIQLFICSAQESTAPAAGERLHQLNFPAENFSMGIPATWKEIDPAVLAKVPAAIRKAVPNAPELKINHGFMSPEGAGSGYPWVAVMITGDLMNDATFENMDWAYRSVDELSKKWKNPGGILQKTKMANMFYDKARHLLWGISQSSFSGIGDLQKLSGAYLTRTGTVQVHCYSRAAEFEKYQPICREIIESVAIDPKVALGASSGDK
jgi:hypothetical protein